MTAVLSVPVAFARWAACRMFGHRYIDDTDPLACRDCHTRTVLHWHQTEETP